MEGDVPYCSERIISSQDVLSRHFPIRFNVFFCMERTVYGLRILSLHTILLAFGISGDCWQREACKPAGGMIEAKVCSASPADKKLSIISCQQ